ncbi:MULTISPECIES: acyltransferase [unclassified Serratia (in: enterobacteria)]|uniref:acyltransferase n=1 Tax=unclassified Serratia (in: enterobacteria) TaxID=2647522 RepID=UPI002119378A|nr:MULTISPECIES: acyltransferase family protein [unclassified Serratia (in: enterobacteria)]
MNNINNNNDMNFENRLSSALINMRALACFAVILIHASIISSPTEWWANNFYGVIPRFAVPFFFMISGVLLINKNYTPLIFLTRRLPRAVLPLIAWSIIYYIWKQDDYKSVVNFSKQLVTFPIYYHLWFLYSMIGVYLSAIVLIPFYNNSSHAEKLCFLGLWLITNFLYPTMMGVSESKNNIIDIYNLHIFYGMSGWFFLGAYLRDIKKPLFKIKAPHALVVFISIILMLALTYWDSIRMSPSGTPFEISEVFRGLNSPLTLTYSVSLFMLLLNIKNNKASAIIAKNSLGIYCLHIIVLSLTITATSEFNISKWINIPLNAFITLTACTLIIDVIRRIPYMKWFT